VFAGFPGGKMIALRLATGTLLWETAVAEPKGETELERVADVVGDPVVQDGQVCAAAYQGRIGCFDEQRGTLTWARNASSTAGLASDAGAFYYVDDAGTIHAVDRASGASLWKQEILARRSVGAPGRVGSYVIVGDFEGYLHVFDREDGHLVGRIDTDDGPITAAPVAVGEGRFIVQTREGHLYAITIR
jgi:outer membrane protein assembly factor BamB